jgi:P pilus assembly chaperone PapD
MKLSEISHYWAARELTQIEKQGTRVIFNAPFAATRFTVQAKTNSQKAPQLVVDGKILQLRKVQKPLQFETGTFHIDKQNITACFNLTKGKSSLEV